MVRRHEDEYAAYAPLLAEFAGLDPSHPRRRQVRDDLLTAYMPVARNVARRFARRGQPLEDLEQVASIGLLNAVERFDPSWERDFLSFAVPTIMGEVRRYFRDATWAVHAPRSLKDRYLTVGAATERLAYRLGRAPTTSELAEHLQLTRDDVVEAIAAHGSYQPKSLDAALTEEGAGSSAALLDTLTVDDPGLDRAEQRAMLRSMVLGLPERERTMLVLRFVHDQTQAEIAAHLCISQMHVSRVLARTLELLRAHLSASDSGPGALLPAG